jgi:hypothetical protein
MEWFYTQMPSSLAQNPQKMRFILQTSILKSNWRLTELCLGTIQGNLKQWKTAFTLDDLNDQLFDSLITKATTRNYLEDLRIFENVFEASQSFLEDFLLPNFLESIETMKKTYLEREKARVQRLALALLDDGHRNTEFLWLSRMMEILGLESTQNGIPKLISILNLKEFQVTYYNMRYFSKLNDDVFHRLLQSPTLDSETLKMLRSGCFSAGRMNLLEVIDEALANLQGLHSSLRSGLPRAPSEHRFPALPHLTSV